HELALQADLVLAPEFPVEKREVEYDADGEAEPRVDDRREERVETPGEVQEVRAVRAEHDELPVGRVHDLRDAPDQVKAVRDGRKDEAEEDPVNERRDDGPDLGHVASAGPTMCPSRGVDSAPRGPHHSTPAAEAIAGVKTTLLSHWDGPVTLFETPGSCA